MVDDRRNIIYRLSKLDDSLIYQSWGQVFIQTWQDSDWILNI